MICFPQDHEALLRMRQDLEQQLQEQGSAVEQQKKRYSEMEVGMATWRAISMNTALNVTDHIAANS